MFDLCSKNNQNECYCSSVEGMTNFYSAMTSPPCTASNNEKITASLLYALFHLVAGSYVNNALTTNAWYLLR